jgi:tetratricopeptide (TPR) repeat protein
MKPLRLTVEDNMKTPAPFKVLALALSLLLPCGAGFAATVDELVKEGDVHDQSFRPKEALESYLPAEKMDPDNVDLLLRIARQYRHQMADTGAVAEKNRFAGMALDYAKRAVALAPGNAEAHLSIAICHAKALELYSNKEKMAALRQVKASADKAIALAPGNDLAWYILGRWHEKVAELSTLKRKVAEMAYGGLPKASADEAAKCFRKAISINPNRSPYNIDLGITYAAMGNQAEARKHIEMGLAMPSKGKDDPETKKRGRDLLATLK